MEEDRRNQEPAMLLEDAWFFGNLLKRKPKIMRCNSEPSKKAEIFVHEKNASSLIRIPSLPPKFGKGKRNLDEEDDEFGPRMGDLIRQAMPCKLSKAPSLPIYRTKKEISFPKMSKLSRMSSLDPSLLIPTKHKPSKNLPDPNMSKNLQQRRTELPIRTLQGIRESKSERNLMRSMSLKSLSDKEVQGFQDLGFTFDNEDLCPIVVDKLARLNVKEETDQIEEGRKGKMIPEAWNATQTQRAHSPPIPKWVDTKSSAQHMKQQIKFWAKSVASNADQEC
ncbi:hypothetical protein V2J09_008785 [Rumex salicifolius]